MEEENHIITQIDNNGVYLSDILIDQKIMTKIKNNGKLDITEEEGIKKGFFDKFKRSNIIYYGIMEGEQSVTIEQPNSYFQVPLVQTKDLQKRLAKINSKDNGKIGYIHINMVQLVIKSTFREGINAPIKLIIEDNRITSNEEERILGTIDGNLGYGIIKFCVNPQYPIPLDTATINNCISVSCDFKRQDLMKKGDRPFVVCYRIAYALSNSSVSLQYKHKEKLYTTDPFNQTSTIIKEDSLGIDFLRAQSRRFEKPLSLGTTSTSLVPRLEPPTTKADLFEKKEQDEIIMNHISNLSQQITKLEKKI